MRPSGKDDEAEWAFCGHAAHNDDFFETYEACSTVAANSPAEGFICETRHTPGIANSDFVLYVTAVESSYCEFAAAYAMYCSLDLDTERPLAGSINFCPSSLSTSPSDFDHQVEVAVHELLHTLVFTETLFDKFIDEDGNKIPLDEVLQTSHGGDRTVKKIITPKVTQVAREYYQCSTLDGAELEDEGGRGTAGSHWETRTLQGELMDGMSGVNIASDRHALSPFTLALLEDSGWYTVNWNAAGLLSWGRNAGCSFAEDTCNAYVAKNPEQPWFCSRPQSDDCTADLHAYGQCRSDILLNGCNVVTPYSNVDCKQAEHEPRTSVDWGSRFGPSSYCLAVETPMVHRAIEFDRTIQTTRSARSGDCFEMRCEDGSYYIDLLGQTIACDYEQQSISLADTFPDFVSGGIKCPDRQRICLTSGCPDDCSGHGWCREKKCYCHLGYTGTNCSKRLCNSQSSYCICNLDGDRDYGTCFPGTEGMEHIVHSSGSEASLLESVKVEFSIESATIEDIETAVPRALSSILEGVSPTDIRVLSIQWKADDAADHESRSLKASRQTVTVSISSSNADRLSAELTNALLSGDFADALSNEGIHYIEGSIEISDAEAPDSKSQPQEDSARVARTVMLYVGGLGTAIFAIIVAYRIHRVRKRHMHIPTSYPTSVRASDTPRPHPLSIDYSARTNPFS